MKIINRNILSQFGFFTYQILLTNKSLFIRYFILILKFCALTALYRLFPVQLCPLTEW
jgi:hypothetical protein